MKITITGLDNLSSKLGPIAQKRLAMAAAAAIRDTAYQAQADLRSEMKKVFDRPTPWALQTVRVDVSKANKTQQTAYIGLSYSSGTANLWEAPSFAPHEVHGGSRKWKASERQLRSAGILPPDMFIAPARDSFLDSYGNIPGPRMVQILSSVKAFGETGYLMNRSGTSRSKTANRYFVMKRAGRPMGIWEKMGPGNVVPVLIFIRAPRYQARFNFYQIAQNSVFRNWRRNFKSRLAEYMKYDIK